MTGTCSIRESPSQFKNQVMPWMYIRALSVALCTEKLHFVSQNWHMENYFYSMWVQLYQNRLFWLSEKLNQQNKSSLCIFQQNITIAIFYWKKTPINFIYNHLFCCNHTCYCVNIVSLMSASRYTMSVSCYHPSYQSRSSMYIHGLIPQNSTELAEAVLIGTCSYSHSPCKIANVDSYPPAHSSRI